MINHIQIANRENYPALEKNIILSSCSQSAISKNVLKAINNYTDSLVEKGMDWNEWIVQIDECKTKFAQLINCDVEEIAILSSVSDAVSSVFSALNLSKSDVFLTDLEFPCIGHVALAQANKNNFTVGYIPHENFMIPLSNYENHLTNQTSLTCVSHVSYYSGFKQNLKEVSKIVHSFGSLLLVDAYQSIGSTNIDVKEMGIDILVAGTQKYMMGIPGISFLYMNKSLSENVQPTVTGWFGQKDPFAFDMKTLEFGDFTAKFNTGTPPIINAYAANAALQDILDVGIDKVESYLHHLSSFVYKRANEIGLQVLGSSDMAEKSAMNAIYVEKANEMEQLLKKERIVVSARQDVIRVAPHIYNTEQDIETALQKIKEYQSYLQ